MSGVFETPMDTTSDAELLEIAHGHLIAADDWFRALRDRYPEDGVVWNGISCPMTCLALTLEFDQDALARVKQRAQQ